LRIRPVRSPRCHGYGGEREAVAEDIRELAARGVVAFALDMRGRVGSAMCAGDLERSVL
jgi:cephalosporin-C deacetylase-like acetyl esterase